jgi:predicted aminopeptidase
LATPYNRAPRRRGSLDHNAAQGNGMPPTTRLHLSTGFTLLTALALPLVTGCDSLPYLAQLAEGQLASQSRTVPVEDVLGTGQLTADEEAKLRLLLDARAYAVDTMGLNAANSYTLFDDNAGSPVAWNLSAARQDALVAKTWTFPFVGEVPYLSFFDKNMLDAAEADLKAQGYDTMTYELDTYSTLGILENPVRAAMLHRGTLSLSDTVIHELLHNTVWRANATSFNESLATFVGRQGAINFLEAKYGAASGWGQFARDYYADGDKVNTFLFQFYNDLATYYSQTTLSSADKIAGRETIFQAARDRFTNVVQPTLVNGNSYSYYGQFPTSNAWVLANYRYNLDLSVFADVYAANGGDWSKTIAVFRAAAEAAGDPYDYLRTWLTENKQ